MSTKASGNGGDDVLDDIFQLLDLANKLEDTEKNRIEAATKYYEAVYLMRRYMERLPQTDDDRKKRELIRDRASHYETRASELMADDSSTVVHGSRASFSPQSPFAKGTFFNEDSSVIPLVPPPPPPSAPFSPRSTDVNSLASLANNKLAIALDRDEEKRFAEAVHSYMAAAELYLNAIKRAESKVNGTQSSPSERKQLEQVLQSMKGRLCQTLNRIEVLKDLLSGKKTIIPQEKIGEKHDEDAADTSSQVLTAEEISVLRRSSLIASGLFLPWSDQDAEDLLAAARNPKARFKDRFLPLNEKQRARFHKFARPPEIVKMRELFTKKTQKISLVRSITPYTIRQQYVTDCSFIASLCICAAFERRFRKQLVTRMIYPQTEDGVPVLNPEGKYMVKLWLNGVARCVVVDDYLPVDKYGNLLCSQTTAPDSPYLELWVCIIEKAYMKLCGGYDFPGSNSGVDLFSLTGWIPERILFAENPEKVRDHEIAPERAWDRIFSASSFGDCLITVSTDRGISPEEIQSTGLVTGHAYAVLSVIETNKGIRLLQLKNPWAHQSWKGKYSSFDLTSWNDPSLCEEVGYDPKLAAQKDDGVFWISWKDILHYFQNFHLSWNPQLFSFRLNIHAFWPKDQGPADDCFNVGENPQYILALSDQAVQRKATVWILVSRHVTKQEQEGAEVEAFLTVHIHRNDVRKRRIWYPGRSGNCILNGAYTNNPHVLVRYDVTGPQDAFLSLVLSQYNKSMDLAYTLSCFCTEAFQLGKPSKDPPFTVECTSAWTKAKSGGPLGTKTCEDNPSFAIAIPPGASASLQLRISTSKTSAVHLVLVPVSKYGEKIRNATGKPVLDTGKYRHGFLVSDRIKVAPGSYALLVTNFHAGELGPFRLVVSSSVKIKVEEIQ